MSQENVEIVRAIERGFRDYLDERFEVRLPPDYPEGEPVFYGPKGIVEMVAMLQDTWGKWWYELDRFLDAGDHIVVFLRILAEGETSHVPIEFDTTHVWTFRGSRAIAMHAYRDRSQALEAVGLSE